MATVSQMEANRLNAQRSTGPRSAEGKASSRFNAFKHGADARSRIIPGEDEDDLLNTTREYYEEFRPEGVVETELVDTLVSSHWEKRRIARLEAAVIQAAVAKQENSDNALGNAIIEDAAGPNVLQKLHRRRQAANRDWFRAEHDLRQRQAERLSRPANPDPPAAEPTATESPDPAPAQNEPNPAAAAPPAPPQTPNPQPLTPNPLFPAATPAPDLPRGFNPLNPHHPPIELCPWCTDHGAIQTNCHFRPRRPRS